MCGLLTIARPGGLRDEERGAALEAMRDALAHRGPDDATGAVYDDWVALAHRRLAILDLAGSRQPLCGEGGDVACVFNGELYNFRALRDRLRALGHRFTTAGDGEVIVHAYEAWGDAAVRELEGMFAFVLYDRRRRRVLAARDRFGIKPLFWAEPTGAVVLASELKAILRHPGVRPVASRTGLLLGAARMHVPWPFTAFDGVYRLPPGATLSIDRDGRVRLERYAPLVESQPPPEPHGDMVVRTIAALERAVERQMVADVEVGAFLSGGIDSTLVVALMTRLAAKRVHTFSVRTTGPDESEVARETARRLGTVHHTVDVAELPFEELTRLPALYDEPFAETSALGVLQLSRSARHYVKVALTGDGGDEIFGGYDTYRWIRHAARAPVVPEWARPGLHDTALRIAAARPWPALIRRGLRGIALVSADAMQAQRDLTHQAWLQEPDLQAASERLSSRVARVAVRGLSRLGPARQAMAVDRIARLPDAMLTKVDIASMAASLEVRVPLLDDALVRFADGLREADLVGVFRGKLVLRRALERLLPRGPAWARKRGFALPLDRWMRRSAVAGPLGALLVEREPLIRHLTGVDAGAAWRGFLGRPTASEGTTAIQLLYCATVALWADRFGVDDARTCDVDAVPLA